ncbi:hypothetical protein DOY81_013198, partial [Sarcophaga bullata]
MISAESVSYAAKKYYQDHRVSSFYRHLRTETDEKKHARCEICKVNLTPSGRICTNHFRSADMVVSGTKKLLLPKAVPIMNTVLKTSFQSMSTSDRTAYEARCLPHFQGNELISNAHLDQMRLPPLTEMEPLNVQSHRDQQTQTVCSGLQNLETALKQ